jgi:hypothetical protein
MSPSSEGRSAHALTMPVEAQWAVRWISTNNPFYVLSAGLFLVGLWLSFGDPQKADDTYALMIGLAGYTLLLAGTAVLLIGFARVWDDARTVLLLVVLMFLATSVTFDHVLVFDVRFGLTKAPMRGIACNLLGLVLAIAISEAVLRSVRLVLPWCYRGPYYALLALFFLYPLALAPFVTDHHGKPMMWGLFGFSSAAALIFLTLLPAVWRGSREMRGGSPWPWPLYPWALFGLLALAVPGRAILLCYSMHQIDVANLYDMTFGPYFLIPFGFALIILLLEAGLKNRRTDLIATALAMPIVLIGMAVVGHRGERIYGEFLEMFTKQLGADPVYCTLVLTAGFYAYAALRQAPWAIEALTASLVALTCVDPKILSADHLASPQSTPLIVVSTLLLGMGVWRHSSWLCLSGSLGLIAGVMLTISDDAALAPYRWSLALHLCVLAMVVLSVAFDDKLGQVLQFVGPGLLLMICLEVIFLPSSLPGSLPKWVIEIHPVLMATLLGGHGLWRWHWPTMAIAGVIFACWSLATGWQAYRAFRQFIVGFDYLALSLLVFALAIIVSLGKSRLLSRWIAAWREKAPEPESVE